VPGSNLLIDSELPKIREELLQRLEAVLPASDDPLSEAMRYSITAAGKLYRPLLCVCLGDAFGADHRDLITIGCALELLHTFTLVHDDIMDKSLLRRGKPTVQAKWGLNLAILAGDALFARSLEVLLVVNNHKAQMYEIFVRALPHLSYGQALDLQQQADATDSLHDYRRMAACKTGTLFSLAAEMAGAAAAVTAEIRQALRELGTLLGIAYQMRDDYLDFFDDERIAANSLGQDLQLKRKSRLVSLGLGAEPEKFTAAIQLAQSDPALGLKRAREILVQSGAATQVRQEFLSARAECLELAKKLPVDTRQVVALIGLMLELPHNP